jgi:TRAP-type C4-dicarboxylate transport system substrate-binding protein
LFLSRHCYQPAALVYSKKWFDTLPKDIRSALTVVDQELVEWRRRQPRIVAPVMLKNLARYGYEVYEPTAEELAAFKEAMKGVADAVAKEIGASGVALQKAIRATM